MVWDRDALLDPLIDLRGTLKKIAKDITPKRTHDLRTRIRRTRAVLRALEVEDNPRGKRLAKGLQPLYKQAGKVRDMDVLTTFAARLDTKGEEKCQARLLEHLVLRRERFARKLDDDIEQSGAGLRRQLRKHIQRIEKQCPSALRSGTNGGNVKETNPVALRLEVRLVAYSKLTAKNLHAYRKRVKDLRDLLTLAGDQDAKLSDDLRDVKDAIGEWHDWNELARIAAKALDHGETCGLRKQIDSAAKSHLERALSRANVLQKHAFNRSATGRAGH